MAAVLMGLGSKTPSSGWSMAGERPDGKSQEARRGYAGDGRRRGLQPSRTSCWVGDSAAADCVRE